MMADWPLGLLGIEIHENDLIPYKPGRDWFPIGPNRIVMHPEALKDFLRQIGETGKLAIIRRLPEGKPDGQ
jgi:hypothetical protein